MTIDNTSILTSGRYDAMLFDMDGVVTDTASVHASCWKMMFDDFLSNHAGDRPNQPFDVNSDYAVYVDGKPRNEGVRDFLASRGITLPEGTHDSPPTEDSIYGLGNRKNELVTESLDKTGVIAFPGTVAVLRALPSNGIRAALVTSSQNAHLILRAVKLETTFDAVVDGEVLATNKIPGKPAPDCFLKAADLLGVPASRAVVIEDAISGVQAGVAGRFGLVIGVARRHDAEALLKNGADLVIQDLAEILP
jgi:beta-phosphoglucomutase family hydrolase